MKDPELLGTHSGTLTLPPTDEFISEHCLVFSWMKWDFCQMVSSETCAQPLAMLRPSEHLTDGGHCMDQAPWVFQPWLCQP